MQLSRWLLSVEKEAGASLLGGTCFPIQYLLCQFKICSVMKGMQERILKGLLTIYKPIEFLPKNL